MPKRLTKIAVDNLKPGATRREIPDGNGLYIVVQPSGRRSYALRYRINRKTRKLTLPSGITLAEARAAASKALVQVEQGHDPGQAKLQEKKARQDALANTFLSVATLYLDLESKKKGAERLRSLDWRRALLERLVYPTLGSMPVSAIRRGTIIQLLDAIEAANGPVMAHSVLAIVRKILRWYAVRDENYACPIVPGMARIKPDARARTRTLSDSELRAVWQTTEKRADPFAALVRFLLVTAARRNEAARMTWQEVEGDTWLLPSHRNKVKRDLERPLSRLAQAVLDAQPRIEGCPYVFTYGRKPIASFSQCKDVFDDACGVTGWTLHDLRRTARSLMSRGGVLADHAERALGHVIGGVRGVYDRHEFHDEKKHAFDVLAAQIESIVSPPPKDNVRQLRRRG